LQNFAISCQQRNQSFSPSPFGHGSTYTIEASLGETLEVATGRLAQGGTRKERGREELETHCEGVKCRSELAKTDEEITVSCCSECRRIKSNPNADSCLIPLDKRMCKVR